MASKRAYVGRLDELPAWFEDPIGFMSQDARVVQVLDDLLGIDQRGSAVYSDQVRLGCSDFNGGYAWT